MKDIILMAAYSMSLYNPNICLHVNSNFAHMPVTHAVFSAAPFCLLLLLSLRKVWMIPLVFRTKGESQFSVLPLPLSFARSHESKGYPNSRFDQGVGLRGRGRYPSKPSIFASLLETKGYPEHTAAR